MNVMFLYLLPNKIAKTKCKSLASIEINALYNVRLVYSYNVDLPVFKLVLIMINVL